MEFKEFNIHTDLIEQLKRNGITTPTKIQQECIPDAMKGMDIEAQSETGSGKTLAFAIPMVEMIQKGAGIQGLVLAPTRELAKQITDEFTKFSGNKRIYTLPVYGGASIMGQIRELPRTEIVVGTPGRIIDLMERGNLNFKNLKMLVLDEADRMLDMGFVNDIEYLMKSLPKKVQTMLFSATYPPEIKMISKKYMKNPKKVVIETTLQKGKLLEYYYDVKQQDKFSLLVHLLKTQEKDLTLIFCKTKIMTDKLGRNLRNAGIKASALHGDLTQNKRELVTDDFKEGRIEILVATDVAARGLHIDNISHVYNYDLPDTADTYTHRIGRTARAGKTGTSISLVCDFDHDNFSRIMRYRSKSIQKMVTPAFERIQMKQDDRQREHNGRPRFGQRNHEGGRPRFGGRSNDRPRHGGGSGNRESGEGRSSERNDRPQRSNSGGFGGQRSYGGVRPNDRPRRGHD